MGVHHILLLANAAIRSTHHRRSTSQLHKMCQFLVLEFSCGESGNRHRKRTEEVWRCDTPADCVINEINMPIAETVFDLRDLDASNFKILYVGGHCDNCVQRMGKEQVEKTMLREDIETKLTKVKEHFEALCIKPPPKKLFRKELAPEKPPLQQAVYDPNNICCSGPCTKPVISIDSRRGLFCEEHTCAAREWGCLMDAVTKRNSPQRSIYCSAHTCEKLGCEMKVAHRDAIYCEKHL